MSPFSFTPRLPRGWPCNTAPALYPLRPSEGLCACAARWRWRTAAWWRWRDSNWSRAEGVGTRRSTSQTRWSRSTRTPRDGGFEHGNYRNSGAGREGGDERLAAGRRGGCGIRDGGDATGMQRAAIFSRIIAQRRRRRTGLDLRVPRRTFVISSNIPTSIPAYQHESQSVSHRRICLGTGHPLDLPPSRLTAPIAERSQTPLHVPPLPTAHDWLIR